MSEATTWNGDCMEVMKDIQEGSVDLVLCDLPYGMTRNKWDEVLPLPALWKQWHRIAKPTAAFVLHCMQPFTTRLISSNMDDFKYCLVWDKVYSTGFLNARKQPLRQHEDIAVFYRKQCTYNPVMRKGFTHHIGGGKGSTNYRPYGILPSRTADEYFPTDIVSIPNRNIAVHTSGGGGGHPTQKPQQLLEYLIKMYSNPGDTVLDSTMGSGSTGVACMHTGRNFLGIEKDERYYKLAVTRIEQAKTEILFTL